MSASNPRPYNRPGPRTLGRAVPWGLLALALVLLAPLTSGAAAPSQGAGTLYLPDLQSEPQSSSAAFAVVQGQEGFGASLVGLQNLSDNSTTVELDLWPKSGTSPATVRRGLGARASMRLDLSQVQDTEGGFYAGRIKAGAAVGGGAHLRWVSGAAVAYEAAPAAHELILPLIARTVYSHTTYIFAQNAGDGPTPNGITMTLFDPEEGSIMVEAVASLDPEETVSWDTAHTDNTFGPRAVGSNAPTGGWLGHAWFQAGQPIAVMAYGDELAETGSSAYLARPPAAAASTQYLPLLRSNYGGESLIAIANAGMRAVDVTIEYRGAPFSPSGANETYRQTLRIAARGAAFIDLGPRERGSRPAPALPRGTSVDQGFVGSATIFATGPVLAVVQDEQILAGRVDGVSAYNAFGPDDLGSQYGAVTLRKARDYQTSVLYIHNPDYRDLDLTVDFFDAGNAAAGQRSLVVPAGGLARLGLNDVASFPDGYGRALLRGSGSFTALVGEQRDPRGKPEVARHRVYIRAQGDNHVSGAGRLTERGSDLDVVVEITGTWPGGVYTGEIRRGDCETGTEVAHELTPFTEGLSTTLLRNVSIQSLIASPHVFVIKGLFPRGVYRDVACGTVDPLAGAEVVDGTLGWPVRLELGEPILTPAVTATSPPPEATPTGPAPTVGPPGKAVFVYLPLAER